MKTGEAAKVLGVDPKTIRNWIDDYGLSRFFSPSALGQDGSIQRMLTENDLLVLNTIRSKKAQGISDWKLIALELESGRRQQDFPQNAISADPRTVPMEQAQQSARAMATLAERDSALARIDDLTMEVERLRQSVSKLEQEKDTLKESFLREIGGLQRELGDRERLAKDLDGKNGLNTELQREIGNLQRQIGKLEGQLEMYRDQGNRSDLVT